MKYIAAIIGISVWAGFTLGSFFILTAIPEWREILTHLTQVFDRESTE